MSSTAQQLPIHHERKPQPFKRHHNASYYVHRVTDSLTTRISKVICGIFLTLLFIVGVAAFITWLSLRPHRPRIHVVDFSIPGLDQPTGFENAEIIFNVTARNSNQAIGYFYDSVEAFVYYRNQAIGSTRLVDSFYQEPKNTTIFYRVLSGATLNMNSDRWMAFRNDRALGTVIFRLDVTAMIRFKVSTWDSKRHRMHSSCDIGVATDGSILPTYKNKRCPVYFT
ncbi:unnamed protein product [Dovyalis caffra]|uniref:Late embryogenesis abundant protein LEA-2 subgroup domain-containing protein n=1 Tax=Dovyalis caffra TaxID=77055 RepID=A0AAV1SKG8_9ROSI|nr:unnamed protein product [Dovyalis caffra]